MSGQERTLAQLALRFADAQLPYMVIGGHANAVWGEPRATLDIDVLIWQPKPKAEEVLKHLKPQFSSRVRNPQPFVEETRVLPVVSEDGLAVDVIFGQLPFEEQAIDRASTVVVGGVSIRFATAEDLILLKIISTRERDLEDIRGVARSQKGKLDLVYLEPRVEELAVLLDRPEIREFWASVRDAEMLSES